MKLSKCMNSLFKPNGILGLILAGVIVMMLFNSISTKEGFKGRKELLLLPARARVNLHKKSEAASIFWHFIFYKSQNF